jgi:hypothetical protein
MNKNNTYLLLFDCNLKYIIRNVEILYKKKKKYYNQNYCQSPLFDF